MAIKLKVLLVLALAFLFTVGFSLSAYAIDPCGQCHLSCYVQEYQCLQDGYSAQQCRTWLNGCIAVQCNNCSIP